MRTHAKSLGVLLVALCPLATLAQPGAIDPATEYETLLRDIRGLQAYNALLTRQISAQQQKLIDVQDAVQRVPELQTQLPPLLIRMVDGLEAFVDRDIPLLIGERADRIASLYDLIERTDTNDAIKLRRVLEAWSIEVEYGGSYQTFGPQSETGQSNLPPGLPDDLVGRNLDFLSIGRIALMFQTSDDDAVTGAWDYRNNSWVILGSEYRNSVRQALRMARNQIAPELVLLPTVPPQVD